MKIEKNKSLAGLNTFGVRATAPVFAEAGSAGDLISLLTHPGFEGRNWLILGGGSNVLFTQDPKVPVVHIQIPGIELQPAGGSLVRVKVGAGVVWHDLVEWALSQDLFGIENLSLIPGLTGAAPMQNIGAYGVELVDVFHSLEAVSLEDGRVRTFTGADCGFGYRTSVFKTELKGRMVITSVTLLLDRNPRLRLDYGDIRQVLADRKIDSPTPRDVSEAVIAIRQSKLPDPAKKGNAGSFFKNPVIPGGQYQELIRKFPDLPGYPVADYPTGGDADSRGFVKVPAGWLIDRIGWKGRREGDAGVHDRQALVLVNHGNATGREILELSREIQKSVLITYGIMLDPEVNIV